jgi:membrane-bound metal-dependent hydrolase YbcI (DUF457 family)
MPDPLTHASISYIAARHLFPRHKKLFVCSALMPDIDGLVGIIYIISTKSDDLSKGEITEIFSAFHPSIPASLLFLPFLTLAVVLLFRLARPSWVPTGLKSAYLLVLSAISVHLGLDMLMTGNKPFWPLPFEAGLGVIPYTAAGGIITVCIALGLLVLDLVWFRKKSTGTGNINIEEL